MIFTENRRFMATQAIWKDRYINLGSSSPLRYRIKIGNNAIYSGRAFKRPDDTNNTIRINDVCADYLKNILPTLTAAQFTALGDVEFITEVQSGSSWAQKDSVTFLNDWSYDYDYDASTMGMAFPIDGHVDARQLLLYTAFNASEVTANFNYADGTSSFQIIPIEITDDFDPSFNLDFARSLRGPMSGTAVIDLSTHPDLVSVEINGVTYEVVGSCSQYALYYVNAYGGWDSLLIQGITNESDNVTRHNVEHDYDNTNVTNRGKDNYLNEIEKRFTLNTGWLTDEGSQRMHHLLNSTMVYMYDFAKAQMIPVIVNNTTTEYKTFKSNQGQIVNYSIDVSVAQSRIRR